MGDVWELYEDGKWGDERPAIAVNVTMRFYAYTWESLTYTIMNLYREYELYRMREDD